MAFSMFMFPSSTDAINKEHRVERATEIESRKKLELENGENGTRESGERKEAERKEDTREKQRSSAETYT